MLERRPARSTPLRLRMAPRRLRGLGPEFSNLHDPVEGAHPQRLAKVAVIVVQGRLVAAEHQVLELAARGGALLVLDPETGELVRRMGADQGVIGPRELPRLWDRHVLNSAAVDNFTTHVLNEGDEFVPSNWVTPRRLILRIGLEY